jgi:RNA polymerase sigma-70 factor (ECF subfamily)
MRRFDSACSVTVPVHSSQRFRPLMRTPNVTDAELVIRAAAGDGEAFGHLVDRYAPAVRRLTRAVLRDPEDADDAAQEGFLAAWRHLGRYDTARPFGPWLMRIVVNAAHDLRRRSRVRAGEPVTDTLPSGGESPDHAAGRSLLRTSLEKALGVLPERQRLAIVLFDAEGYSHAEIAELLGVPEGTARSDVFHARRVLREALAPFLGDSI